jgi:hypothetical protein
VHEESTLLRTRPGRARPDTAAGNIGPVDKVAVRREVRESMWSELPRQLWIVGTVFFVVGLVVTIILVVTDSSCNAASNLSNMAAGTTSTATCAEQHGGESLSFLVLVVGALMIVVGTMILPVLRDRNARRAANSPPPSTPPISHE